MNGLAHRAQPRPTVGTSRRLTILVNAQRCTVRTQSTVARQFLAVGCARIVLQIDSSSGIVCDSDHGARRPRHQVETARGHFNEDIGSRAIESCTNQLGVVDYLCGRTRDSHNQNDDNQNDHEKKKRFRPHLLVGS